MQPGAVLISESRIADAVEEVAGRVSRDYDLSKVVLVGAMDGAVCFLSDLMRAFGEPVDVTTVRMRRYDGTEGGAVTVSWLPLRDRIEGREVLIVEGIVDTGETCAVLSQRLLELGAASINVCALLDKPSRVGPMTSRRRTSGSRCLTCSSWATAWTTTARTETFGMSMYLREVKSELN